MPSPDGFKGPGSVAALSFSPDQWPQICTRCHSNVGVGAVGQMVGQVRNIGEDTLLPERSSICVFVVASRFAGLVRPRLDWMETPAPLP